MDTSSQFQKILNQLPNNWSQISYDSYLELQELQADKSLEGMELIIEQLSVLLDTDSTDPLWDDLSAEDLFTLINRCGWLASEPKPQLLLDYQEVYRFKPLNQLTLGEFIDVEHWIKEGYDFAHKIAAILYKKTRRGDWDHLEWEPYNYDLDERSLEFNKMSVAHIWGIWKEYESWKSDFIKNYDPLFADTSKEPDDFKEDELTGREKIDKMKEEMEQRALEQWSWENVLWGLSGGDISRFNDIFGVSVILVFNVLSMRKVLEV